MAKRTRYLFVCTNERPRGTSKGSCATRGAIAIHAALKAEVAARKLAMTEVRACTSSCLDVCWAGPAVLVSPDDVVYGRVTIEDIPELVDAIAEGKVLERLALGPKEFDQTTAGPGLPELPEPSDTGAAAAEPKR